MNCTDPLYHPTMNENPTPIECLVDTSLLNDPARLRERADAIEAWNDGKPVDKFIDGKWIEIEEQTAFFFDRRYRARPITPMPMEPDVAEMASRLNPTPTAATN